jgi:hypothetical protein
MFGWWRNQRRRIFRYWDGTRTRAADPLELQARLFAHPKYDSSKVRILDKDDSFGQAAYADTLKAVRDTFGIKPLSDANGLSGMTEEETWDLFTSFCEYLEALKKNTATSPTLEQPTELAAD